MNYGQYITANINNKGVFDIDTVKGCTFGMTKYPNGGCYGLCYAAKIATAYGFDFSKSISREINDNRQLQLIEGSIANKLGAIIKKLSDHKLSWFRVGTMGDPCHNWELTENLCGFLYTIRTPIIITKHWNVIPNKILNNFKKYNAIINTSISPLDTNYEIMHRVKQFARIKKAGIKSILRVVSCKFGQTNASIELKKNKIFYLVWAKQ